MAACRAVLFASLVDNPSECLQELLVVEEQLSIHQNNEWRISYEHSAFDCIGSGISTAANKAGAIDPGTVTALPRTPVSVNDASNSDAVGNPVRGRIYTVVNEEINDSKIRVHELLSPWTRLRDAIDSPGPGYREQAAQVRTAPTVKLPPLVLLRHTDSADMPFLKSSPSPVKPFENEEDAKMLPANPFDRPIRLFGPDAIGDFEAIRFENVLKE